MHVSLLITSHCYQDGLLKCLDSASSAVIVRLAYVETFRDPEFLYATVPIAIWSEIEMSLAITAGSLSTLRPLYRLLAERFSWRTSLFSNRRSLPSVDATHHSALTGGTMTTSKSGRKKSNSNSCSESERNIVDGTCEDLELEVCEPALKAKYLSITKVTNVQVDISGGATKR